MALCVAFRAFASLSARLRRFPFVARGPAVVGDLSLLGRQAMRPRRTGNNSPIFAEDLFR
jgi:hypothetical protein